MTPHEKAQQGLLLLKESILELLENHPEGLQNAQIADLLGLRSDYKRGIKITFRGRCLDCCSTMAESKERAAVTLCSVQASDLRSSPNGSMEHKVPQLS